MTEPKRDEEVGLLRQLFDAMPQLGWTALPDGFIDYYNRGWFEYSGTTHEQMKGWGWTSIHHPDELDRVVESWKRSIATGKAWELEFPLRRHDGVYRWFLSRATPIYDAGGRLVRWVGINTDIDDQKRAERRLAELDRAKTSFFSNVSHELRTPLTLILGPIEDALRSEAGMLPRDGVALVQRNAARLLRLVNTLLDFTRIEAGRTTARLEETDIAALTRSIAAFFESAMRHAGLTYEVDCSGVTGRIFVDREMWEKVVLNLLSNALKFTFEGRVTVNLATVSEGVELTVTDTGTGIPTEEIAHVFDRFHRVQGARARTFEGSGIGLSLVRDLVRLHGGSVDVTSTPGLGTTFVVRLPTGIGDQPHPEHAAAVYASSRRVASYVEEAQQWLRPVEARVPAFGTSGSEEVVSVAVRGARVFVIDDNPDMRDYIRASLAPHFRVSTAADGESAWVEMQHSPPDLVVTDVMMPQLGGLELLARIRSTEATRHLPVIVLSARAGEEARVDGMARGADDYLAKPFSTRELIARVAAHLQLALARGSVDRERARLAAVRTAARIGVFEWNVRSGTTYWSPELYQLLGLEVNGCVPSSEEWTARLVEEDREPGWRAFESAVRERKTHHETQQRIRRPDGTVRWLHVSNEIAYGDDGTWTSVVGAVVDVQPLFDQRERDEARLRERLESAEEERRRLLTLFQEVPAILNYLRGPDLVMEIVHPLAQRFHGDRPLQGKPVREALPELIGQPFIERLERVFQTGVAFQQREEPAMLGVEGRLQQSWWTSSYLPIRGATGEVDGVLTFDLDVSDVVRANHERQALLAAAESANQAKDDFLAMLGHELRNPLAPILTALQLLRMRSPETWTRELDVVERQAQHLITLVEDLLDVSRIARGKLTLARKRVELATIVDAALETVSPLLDAARHEVVVDVPREGLPVDVDPRRMTQVFVNLLTNAAKYTPERGHIRVVTRREDGHVVLAVEDDGSGISPELLPHVFERFFQTKQAAARSKGGLGVGLAIVANLVELHGGTVTAASEGLGRGSRFAVRLALAEGGVSPSADAPPPPRPSGGGELKVLIVDDNPDACELLGAVLSHMGYKTFLANDGPEALELAATAMPRFALLDIGLPVMDGFELARELRAVCGPDLRLIAVTGYGQEHDRRRSAAAGFEAHLTKPVDIDQVVRLLQS